LCFSTFVNYQKITLENYLDLGIPRCYHSYTRAIADTKSQVHISSTAYTQEAPIILVAVRPIPVTFVINGAVKNANSTSPVMIWSVAPLANNCVVVF
jgi:hypothetical protein